jgi:hypothetical protein
MIMSYLNNVKRVLLVAAVAVVLALTLAGKAGASDPYWDKKDREADAAKAYNLKMDNAAYFKQKDLQKIDRAADALKAANADADNAAWWNSVQSQLNAAAKQKGTSNYKMPVYQQPSGVQYRPTMTPSAAQAVAITQSKAARDAHFRALMNKSIKK